MDSIFYLNPPKKTMELKFLEEQCDIHNDIRKLKNKLRLVKEQMSTPQTNPFMYLDISDELDETRQLLKDREKEYESLEQSYNYYKNLLYGVRNKYSYHHEKVNRLEKILNENIPCAYCGSLEHLSHRKFWCKTSSKFCECTCTNEMITEMIVDNDTVLEWSHDGRHPSLYSIKYDDWSYDYHELFYERTRIQFIDEKRTIILDTLPHIIVDFLVVIEEMKDYFLSWEGLKKTNNEIMNRFESYKEGAIQNQFGSWL